MKANDLLEMTTQDLEHKSKSLREELFNLKFQLSLGQLKSTANIRDIRRNIARINTVLRHRELGNKEV